MTEKTYCSACGKQIDSRADICPKCGVRQTSRRGGSTGGKDKTTAALLALFLGGIGIHKFYVGDSKKGVLYLVFFWTFIPAILALIQAIRWFMMSDGEFQQYVKSIKK